MRIFLRILIAALSPFIPAFPLFLASTISAVGQEADQATHFKTGVTNVQVDVLVMQKGQLLKGLSRGDFVVRDEGRAQTVLALDEESTPLDLVLLLDDSPGQKGDRRSLFAAASDALRQMRPKDRVAVISYGSTPKPRLELPLTSDQNEIGSALNRVEVGGPSPGIGISYPAIQWAVWLLASDAKVAGDTGVVRKRAIVVDSLSKIEFSGGFPDFPPDEPLIQQLWGMDAVLHATLFRSKGQIQFTDSAAAHVPYYRRGNVQHIAKATGGDVTIDPKGNLLDLLARIRSSYSLSYKAPEAKPGELRHVSVELSDEAKKKYPGAEIKAREGYIAR